MKTLVPVVFATDDIFAPYCCVSMASLIDNRDPERQYALYVFYDELTEKNISRLSSMATKNVTVECINIGSYVDRDLLYTHRRLTVATYYRFFVADVLPQYDKLLYLDSDIAILGDVGELFDINIGDNLLGGIVIYRDTPQERRVKEAYLKELMDVAPDKYVNAGILSMNLKAFRENDIKNKCLKYIGEHRELRWLDQDVLNAVCRGRIVFLPTGWNMSQFYYEDDLKAGLDLSHVKLIHYLDRFKPWLVTYRLSHLYFYQYAQYTPYAAELRETFLKINQGMITDVRMELYQMAGRAEVGPRYFIRCIWAWVKAKVRCVKG